MFSFVNHQHCGVDVHPLSIAKLNNKYSMLPYAHVWIASYRVCALDNKAGASCRTEEHLPNSTKYLAVGNTSTKHEQMSAVKASNSTRVPGRMAHLGDIPTESIRCHPPFAKEEKILESRSIVSRQRHEKSRRVFKVCLSVLLLFQPSSVGASTEQPRSSQSISGQVPPGCLQI